MAFLPAQALPTLGPSRSLNGCIFWSKWTSSCGVFLIKHECYMFKDPGARSVRAEIERDCTFEIHSTIGCRIILRGESCHRHPTPMNAQQPVLTLGAKGTPPCAQHGQGTRPARRALLPRQACTRAGEYGREQNQWREGFTLGLALMPICCDLGKGASGGTWSGGGPGQDTSCLCGHAGACKTGSSCHEPTPLLAMLPLQGDGSRVQAVS